MKIVRTSPAGFTLIEIMVVVGIMGLIMTMAIPNIYQLAKKEGMRRAVSDVREVLGNARAQAILQGREVDVIFHPVERRFEIGSSATATAAPAEAGPDPGAAKPPSVAPGTGVSGTIPEDISLEMLDVNLLEYNESEWTRVRFFPNGTSDEMTIILRSDKNDYRKLTLEPTTGLISVGAVR
jgi:prepilin-type N-terminal cleavage/methylation domain-containing protein